MLEELHVRDLALIEDVWLEFGPGMTVLTGETGAGKTALLGALKLLLGDRADSASVRAGAPETLVEGRFSDAGSELVVKRRVTADGRSKCVLGDEMSTVGGLAERVGPLVDLHGQHEHQALLTPATHAGYLDRWAGETALAALADYRADLAAYRDALDALSALESRIAQAAENADYLRFIAEDIDAVAPELGEDDALEARLPALRHAERLTEASALAASALRGDGGALDRVAAAAAALGKVAGIDPALDDIAARLAEAEALVDDIGSASRSYRDTVEHDPRVLDEVLGRLSALSGLKKKYGPTLEDVVARRESARQALLVAEDASAERLAAQQRVTTASDALRASSERLAAERTKAAPGFADAVGGTASELAMEGSRLEIGFEELPFDSWTAEGPHRVEFLYSPAPGQPARPLARIASGGEISRVMLALKSVLGSADRVKTLVFDEVDAGVGGSTAQSVGRLLARLAATHQVIVVTHLAQVAAYADAQLVVRKDVRSDGAFTSVVTVAGEERVAEIARMLSGNDSDASRAHARELLESSAV